MTNYKSETVYQNCLCVEAAVKGYTKPDAAVE